MLPDIQASIIIAALEAQVVQDLDQSLHGRLRRGTDLGAFRKAVRRFIHENLPETIRKKTAAGIELTEDRCFRPAAVEEFDFRFVVVLDSQRDAAFRTLLHEETHRLAYQFDPALEKQAWKALMSELIFWILL